MNKEISNFTKELLDIIDNNKEQIDSMIPESGLYSNNTYGTFERYERDPNEYFLSDDWKNVIRDKSLQAVRSKNETKKEFKNLINEYLEDELKFFGDADLAKDIIEEKIDLRKSFIKFKLSMFQNHGESIDSSMDLEDFKEEFLGEMIDYIANKDKTKPEDLYNNININLLISPLSIKYFAEDTKIIYSKDHDSLLLSEETIEILNNLDITKEDIDRYYIQNRSGVRIEDINKMLLADELMTYDTLKDSSGVNNMLLTKDLMKVMESEGEAIPYVLINKNIKDFLENHSNGNDRIKLKDGVFCLHNEKQVTFLTKFDKDIEVKLEDIREEGLNIKKVPESVFQKMHNSYYPNKSSRKIKNN
jgi:hypothetical protein